MRFFGKKSSFKIEGPDFFWICLWKWVCGDWRSYDADLAAWEEGYRVGAFR